MYVQLNQLQENPACGNREPSLRARLCKFNACDGLENVSQFDEITTANAGLTTSS
jgi:hypothetical protein